MNKANRELRADVAHIAKVNGLGNHDELCVRCANYEEETQDCLVTYGTEHFAVTRVRWSEWRKPIMWKGEPEQCGPKGNWFVEKQDQ